MSEISAEELAKRILANGVLDARQVEAAFGELGSRDASYEDFTGILLRKELLTNFQLDRLVKNEKGGYFYGDYKVLYLVGTGTFARVYRAVNMKSGKVFAVKVLRKRFREDPANVDQFLREGEIGTRLRHPNIVAIYEVANDREGPYMVMEFVEGTNLRSFVKSRRKFSPKESVALMTDICSGLAHATEKGMSHRDLKLSNVLVTSRMKAKLVDFGLAAVAESHREGLAEESINTRTIDYAGLERATGCRQGDPRSDIFFAGCIFYHILTGVPPMIETKDRLQRMSVSRFQSIRPLQLVDPDIPRAVVSVVNRALELPPEKRYQRASDMVNDLKKVAQRLAAGTADVEVTSADPKAAAAETEDLEGNGKSVMLLESKPEFQDAIREALKKRGYRVLVIGDPKRALARFSEFEPAPADSLIISAVELGEEALKVFNRFAEMTHTRKLPMILLLEPKQSILMRSAKMAGHRVVVTMPLKVRELRETLQTVFRLVPSSTPTTEG